MQFIDHFRFARHLFRLILSAFDLNVQVNGAANAASEAGPAVVAMVGEGIASQAVLTAYFPRVIQAVVRPGIWDNFFLSGLGDRLELLRIPPTGGRLNWIRKAKAVLGSGGRVGLFIPGGFAAASTLSEEIRAAALLCKITGCAFIPVASDGCEKVLPRGSYIPRVSPIRMMIGKPVRPEIDAALSNRSRDWSRMFQTDLFIFQQRLLSCPEGFPAEFSEKENPVSEASCNPNNTIPVKDSLAN